MMTTYLPNRAGKAARLEEAAQQVLRAAARGRLSQELTTALTELRAALAHPTDDGRYRGPRLGERQAVTLDLDAPEDAEVVRLGLGGGR